MMTLEEFLRQTQAEANESAKLEASQYPYPESVFTDVVMQHMLDVGMTHEPVVCHFAGKVGNAQVRLSGYAISEEADQLDVFVSLYKGVDVVTPVPDSEIKGAAEQCLRFLGHCANGKFKTTMEPSHQAYNFALTVHGSYEELDQIRVFVLTDGQAKSKNFASREIAGKSVRLEVMDIERLHRHLSEGKPRDELEVNFDQLSGGPIACVFVPGNGAEYDYALAAIPGEALRSIYDKYGSRLLEANVRSFLSTTGKVNKGIRDTLRTNPSRFMAYNNGIVIVCDEIHIGKTKDGGPGITWIKGLQIVNGGQTTASIYFAARKDPSIDLGLVRVPAKVVVLRDHEPAAEEALVSDISRFANSQNSVKQSDLSANKPYHVELEKLSQTTYCPDGVGRWFYERAAGSYSTMLARDAKTPAMLKQLREKIVPPARRITKTDLAKYMNAWGCRPDLVSLGSQKNFEKFMEELNEAGPDAKLPDVAEYKEIVAKAILFKRATSLVRPMFQAFQGNVAAYLVSVIADRLGKKMNLEKIWTAQDISGGLTKLMKDWAGEVNAVLHKSANGRMISEWAKKPECWDKVRSGSFDVVGAVPELKR